VTGPTGVTGNQRMTRRERVSYRVGRSATATHWAFRRSPFNPATFTRTVLFWVFGVTWQTSCRHETGFTHGWPPSFKRCRFCDEYGLTRIRLGYRVPR